MNIEFIKTCSACPEQYDAFLDGTQVGYLLVRNGYFRVDFGFCGGDTVYETLVDGDWCFEENERMYLLNEAKEAIIKELLIRGWV